MGVSDSKLSDCCAGVLAGRGSQREPGSRSSSKTSTCAQKEPPIRSASSLSIFAQKEPPIRSASSLSCLAGKEPPGRSGSKMSNLTQASTRSGSSLSLGTAMNSPSESWQGSKSSVGAWDQAGVRLVLGKYWIGCGEENILGEGASSVCSLGTNVETGERVAVKEYKASTDRKGAVKKFRRQVTVLQELQKPFERPADDTLWSEDLARVDPSSLFVQLLDYSRDERGEPGWDSEDGSLCVVTELADYTLQSFLKERKEQNSPLPAQLIREFAKEIVLAVAGLSAKGFVHLDLKPANLMWCNGRWKVIDMDGCVRAGATVKQSDNSISFSPCYCAPEFARFIASGGSSIIASPSLDAWSVGMMIGDMVNLCPMLRGFFHEIRAGHSRKEGTACFLKWLGDLAVVPLPRRVQDCEADLIRLLSDQLLVCRSSQRQTLAQSLSAPYFQGEPRRSTSWMWS